MPVRSSTTLLVLASLAAGCDKSDGLPTPALPAGVPSTTTSAVSLEDTKGLVAAWNGFIAQAKQRAEDHAKTLSPPSRPLIMFIQDDVVKTESLKSPIMGLLKLQYYDDVNQTYDLRFTHDGKKWILMDGTRILKKQGEVSGPFSLDSLPSESRKVLFALFEE